MKNSELVQKYLDIFFVSGNYEKLSEICDKNLQFEGPFVCASTLVEYIKQLSSSPFEKASYNLLEWFEKEDSINLLYKFQKPGVETLMSQYFTCSNGKIVEIKLIFDTRIFGSF